MNHKHDSCTLSTRSKRMHNRNVRIFLCVISKKKKKKKEINKGTKNENQKLSNLSRQIKLFIYLNFIYSLSNYQTIKSLSA